MAAVELRDLRKSYGAVDVIRGIDLDVADGEFCVFVGPSGCGKSTLLRMVAGLEEISAGTLSIGGRPMTRVAPANRGVAMVFQSYALYPHMTVAENITFGLRMAGAPKPEVARRLQKASDMLQLGPYLARKPAQLSGGQRQRVAIGRAVVREPDVFLFDEPLSNLDAALRVATRIEIGKLHQELGATMIYVTHDQVEAMTMADKIVVLNAGRVEQVGSPLDLYHRPRSLFVAGFIGSPGMNVLDVALAPAEGGTLATLPGGGRLLLPGPCAAPSGPAVLGVRPEHLRVAEQGDAVLDGTVTLAEQLGAETILHCAVAGGAGLVVRADGLSRLRPGDPLRIALAAASCHLFAPGGAAIRSGSLL
jgi:multiple sugar transport system ATP-binding protein